MGLTPKKTLTPKNKKWTKKDEMMYEELCLDNYDEEDCSNFVSVNEISAVLLVVIV